MSEPPRSAPREGALPPLAQDVLALMERHRSIRSFRDAPVPDALVERAVAAAQHTATSSWVQAYHLLQVEDPAARSAVGELAGGQPQVTGAGAFFVVCADERRHSLVARESGTAHVRAPESFVIAVVDASLFGQSLCLAFESLGLGTCYIGGIRNDLPRLDALLGLPDGVMPLFGLCVGEPAEDPEVRPRLAPSAVWSKDRYPSDKAVLDAVAAHDRDAAAYYERRGQAGRTWSGGVTRKYARDPRPGVAAYYASKGAGIRD